MEKILEIENLSMAYQEGKNIIKNLSFSVEKGQVIGYIGPNGAGKSTTIKMILGILDNYKGSIKINGQDIKKDKSYKYSLGYVPEIAELYEALSPRDYFLFFGGIYGLGDDEIESRSKKLMEIFGIEEVYDKKISSFSKGMKQKVLIISSILHNPDLIIFDEPLSGLDANSVMIFKELIDQLAKEGKTIFYSSHLMDVVEKVSDRIILLQSGEIIADGDFESLKSEDANGNLEGIFNKLTGNDGSDKKAKEIIDAIRGENNACSQSS